MEYLLTGAEMALCDRRTSEVIGIPSLVLMERAALSVADGAEEYLRGTSLPVRDSSCGPDGRPCSDKRDSRLILAAAGRGNNGADALAAGRILLDRGYHVLFCRLSGTISPDSSFAVQEKILRQYGCKVVPFQESILATGAKIPALIIDGLFGTGLSRGLTGEAADCVRAINRCRKVHGSRVLAVDIPSGISSDDGRVMGCAVECDETRTFAYYKRGHFLYPGAAFSGRIHLAQIGITARAFEKTPGMFTLTGETPSQLLPVRDPNGNKGTFGKILLIAGRRNMCGAAVLAARACMASGAGMVKIFTEQANRLLVQSMLPEALLDTFGEEETPAQVLEKLRTSIEWADVAAAGPAMGTDETAAALLRTLLEQLSQNTGEKRLRGLVLDADALRILARDPELEKLLRERPAGIPCILTPHLAEFAALAGCSVRDCLTDRAAIVQAQADRFRCTIACKDARTLVAAPGETAAREIETGEIFPGKDPKEDISSSHAPVVHPRILYLNSSGNSGMAAAGSGDVLTGMTAAILAAFTPEAVIFHNRECGFAGGKTGPFPNETYKDGFAAACCAVFLHGKAGDDARNAHGERAMTAGDLVEALRRPAFWR